MSELTDNAIAMLRICVHDGTENTAQVYFAQLLNQISAIEEVRDGWYRAWKQEQAARSLTDDEVERVKAERDAWKATACMMPEWMTEVCQQCPLGYLHKCPDNADHAAVCKAAVLAHFSAPEEDA